MPLATTLSYVQVGYSFVLLLQNNKNESTYSVLCFPNLKRYLEHLEGVWSLKLQDAFIMFSAFELSKINQNGGMIFWSLTSFFQSILRTENTWQIAHKTIGTKKIFIISKRFENSYKGRIEKKILSRISNLKF
jgi:hypothetical protein